MTRNEPRDTSIKVNSADPGYTATDLNGNRGHQTAQEAVVEPLRLAMLDETDRRWFLRQPRRLPLVNWRNLSPTHEQEASKAKLGCLAALGGRFRYSYKTFRALLRFSR